MDANQRRFEWFAKSRGLTHFSTNLGRYNAPVVRRMFEVWEHLSVQLEDLEAKLQRLRDRNTELVNQCRDHDARRTAAVAQSSSLAEEVERLQATVDRLLKEAPDPQEHLT